MSRPSARHVLPGSAAGSGGGRPVDPYAQLLRERIVFLGTRIDDTSANEVTAQLIHLESSGPGRDIHLYVNSPGGSFAAMTAIHDAMRFVRCDVVTVCIGQAASAAAVLLAAGTPGKRLITPGAQVLLRGPSLGDAVRGDVSDLEIQAEELRRTREQVESLLAGYTGQEAGQIRADLERDRILDARSAVAYGLVDRLTDGGTAGVRASGPR